ncbi:MAG: hypothetical protein HY985_03135 [Magnetospirillum sp.]|nr:hypothetical protein [Magnetospirillum sp.]
MHVTEAERLFLHELNSIKRDPLGKRIIHFFGSMAPQGTDMTRKTDAARHYIKKAFAKSPYTEIFAASNGDIFVAYSHVTVSEVLSVCSKIEKLFCEDTVVTARNTYNEYGFYKVCDAGKDLDKVFSAFKAIIAVVQPDSDRFTKKPMSIEDLSFLSEKLRTADLRNAIFNQPIYFIGEKVPSIEFLEFYVATQQIEDMFLPGVRLTSNPWLFNALREHFDRAVLKAMIGEIAEYRHKSFSINVSLPMVLSREFAEFYESLPTKLAGKILVEVDKTDLVQNYSLYKDAAALAGEKGLKLCIDGLDWHDFEVLCLRNTKPKPHYMKVAWHNDLQNADDHRLGTLVDAIKSNEGTEIILTRCESPKCFPFARTLGIRYVQGKLADQLFKTGMAL